MRTYTRNFILTAVCALTILLVCPTLQANSVLMITGNYSWNYGGISGVGPYSATLDGVANTPVFCLDLHQETYVGQSYPGTLSTGSPNFVPPDMSLQQAEEVSFLASYALYLEAQGPTDVQTVEGPIQMAIWQIMGTLTQNGNNTPQDPAAQTYVSTAQAAYLAELITPYVGTFSIWSPDTPSPNGLPPAQRFAIGVRNDAMIRSAIPEPGTVVFLGTGVLLMALSRIRRRR